MKHIAVISILIGSLSFPVMAQQAAHVHGIATMNLAIDNQQLQIEFVSPADGIVGFEYEPSSASEREAVKEAITRLRNPDSLIALPTAADCELQAVEVERHAEAEQKEHRQKDEHDHDDHGHDESDTKGSHSEFHAHYHFNCDGSSFTEIELTVFRHWPRIETIQVQALTSTGQMGGNINANNPVIRLP